MLSMSYCTPMHAYVYIYVAYGKAAKVLIQLLLAISGRKLKYIST